MTLIVDRLAADFATSVQLSLTRMPEVAAAGFRSVVCNRPDFEGGVEQPTSDALQAAARAAGLVFVHHPMHPVSILPGDVEAFARLLARLPKPVLAFCRTGCRSATLYRAGPHGHVRPRTTAQAGPFDLRCFMESRIGFGRTVQMSFEQAVERVTQALAAEGFGVLTEIDVAATFKKKLGVDSPPCRILGACNPQLARLALQADPQVALLLPCNVVVRDDEGGVRVDFMDPDAVLALVDSPEVRSVAADARQRLRRACEAL